MLAYLAVIGLATWIFGRFGNIMRDTGMRRAALTATLLLIVAGAWGLLRFEGLTAQSAAAVTDEGGVRWEKFSEKKVAELSSQGKTVFIDFTAAWCWTCKVNEKSGAGLERRHRGAPRGRRRAAQRRLDEPRSGDYGLPHAPRGRRVCRFTWLSLPASRTLRSSCLK
ncbi:MAG: thioredoxin family protein [Deltaproteobacteria bacterium]|nr:thioredoxin family protein [Deltaproteobacteria bacterium]